MQPDHGRGPEAVLLGMLLRDCRHVPIVAGRLSPEDFGPLRHQKLWALMLELEEAQPGGADVELVAQVLERRKLQSEIGGREFVVGLCESVPSVAFLENHVDAVLQESRRRQLSAAIRRAQARFEKGDDTDEIARELDDRALGVLARQGHRKTTATAREADRELRAQLEARRQLTEPVSLVATPIQRLTKKLDGGLLPGDLTVIAARASMGKTMFAEGLADHASGRAPVLFFSLEMDRAQLIERAYRRSSSTRIPRLRTVHGDQAETALKITEGASRIVAQRQVVYCDDFDADLARIRAECQRQQRDGGLSLVVVDYLQLVRVPKPSRNRQEDVAALSRDFKRLARELAVPVALVAQLNRELERREDKRPRLSDLRESGAIEQDADRVLLLHRPRYFDEHADGSDEVIVAKNRHGETGKVPAHFDTQRLLWGDTSW